MYKLTDWLVAVFFAVGATGFLAWAVKSAAEVYIIAMAFPN